MEPNFFAGDTVQVQQIDNAPGARLERHHFWRGTVIGPNVLGREWWNVRTETGWPHAVHESEMTLIERAAR